MTVGMVFLLWSMNVFIKAVGLGNSSCSGAAAVCGNVTIPYPFGIEPGCYIDDWFTTISLLPHSWLSQAFLEKIRSGGAGHFIRGHTSRQLSYVMDVS